MRALKQAGLAQASIDTFTRGVLDIVVSAIFAGHPLMNTATFLARLPPAATPTVTAAGSPAPDPGAFPGWAGVLFIIIGGLAAYGIYSWKAVKTAFLPPNAANSGFRDRIARYVLNGSIWGLIVLASFIVLMPALVVPARSTHRNASL